MVACVQAPAPPREPYTTCSLQGDCTRSVTYIVEQNPILVLARLLTEDTLLVSSAGEAWGHRGDMQLLDTVGAAWAMAIRDFLAEYQMVRRYEGTWPPPEEAASLPATIPLRTITIEDRVYLARRRTQPGTAFQTYIPRMVHSPGQPHPTLAHERDWIVVNPIARGSLPNRTSPITIQACAAPVFYRFYTIMRQAEQHPLLAPGPTVVQPCGD